MSGKFMRVKKVVIPMFTALIIMIQMAGCGFLQPTDMIALLESGESITIEIAQPYELASFNEDSKIEWVELDQLQTYKKEGFRQAFDEVHNIKFARNADGTNGKSGVLFVNAEGKRDGNSTLANAFRNKAFISKYWTTKKRTDMAKLSHLAYTDIGDWNDSIAASINAYFDLLNDPTNPNEFQGGRSLSREQFYALLFKAENPVRELDFAGNLDAFAQKMGGVTPYTAYAKEIAPYDFLQSSLDWANISRPITRAEAIYLVINHDFPLELAKVTGEEPSYADCENAGDLALKVGFKEKDGTPKPGWQAYILSYMIKNPRKGLQEELYKATVVASQLGLFGSSSSISSSLEWEEPISKKDAILLVINAQNVKNKLYGYLSEPEYGKAEPTVFPTLETTDTPTTEENTDTPADEDTSGYVYELKPGEVIEQPETTEMETSESEASKPPATSSPPNSGNTSVPPLPNIPGLYPGDSLKEGSGIDGKGTKPGNTSGWK